MYAVISIPGFYLQAALRYEPGLREEAVAIGLCDQLVPEEDLMSAVAEFAHQIAGLAPLAVRSIKRTLRHGIRGEVLSAIDREINEQNWLFRTADHREGTAALADKRAPVFRAQ